MKLKEKIVLFRIISIVLFMGVLGSASAAYTHGRLLFRQYQGEMNIGMWIPVFYLTAVALLLLGGAFLLLSLAQRKNIIYKWEPKQQEVTIEQFHSNRIKSSFSIDSLKLAGICFMVTGFSLLFCTILFHIYESTFLLYLPVPVFLLNLGFIGKRIIGHKKFGRPFVQLARNAVKTGKHFRGEIVIKTPISKFSNKKSTGVHLELTCINSLINRIEDSEGKQVEYEWRALWQEQGIGEPRDDGNGGTVIPFNIYIPPQVPPTDNSNTDSKINWWLNAKASIRGIDFDVKFPVRVEPGGEYLEVPPLSTNKEKEYEALLTKEKIKFDANGNMTFFPFMELKIFLFLGFFLLFVAVFVWLGIEFASQTIAGAAIIMGLVPIIEVGWYYSRCWHVEFREKVLVLKRMLFIYGPEYRYPYGSIEKVLSESYSGSNKVLHTLALVQNNGKKHVFATGIFSRLVTDRLTSKMNKLIIQHQSTDDKIRPIKSLGGGEEFYFREVCNKIRFKVLGKDTLLFRREYKTLSYLLFSMAVPFVIYPVYLLTGEDLLPDRLIMIFVSLPLLILAGLLVAGSIALFRQRFKLTVTAQGIRFKSGKASIKQREKIIETTGIKGFFVEQAVERKNCIYYRLYILSQNDRRTYVGPEFPVAKEVETKIIAAWLNSKAGIYKK